MMFKIHDIVWAIHHDWVDVPNLDRDCPHCGGNLGEDPRLSWRGKMKKEWNVYGDEPLLITEIETTENKAGKTTKWILGNSDSNPIYEGNYETSVWDTEGTCLFHSLKEAQNTCKKRNHEG